MSTGLQDLLRGQNYQLPQLNIEVESEVPPQAQQRTSGVATSFTIYGLSLAAAKHQTIHEQWRESFYKTLLLLAPEGPQVNLTDSYFGYLRRRLNNSSDTVKNAVDLNLQVMHGNPVFRGTRIPIYQIIEELADGTPLAEIPEGYPSLSLEQIRNGLDFAASVLRIYDDKVPSR